MNIREMTTVLPLVVCLAIPLVLLVRFMAIARTSARLAAGGANFSGAVSNPKGLRRTMMGMATLLLTLLLWSCIPSGSSSESRKDTSGFLLAIIAGLENYHSEYGEYPVPLKDSEHLKLDGKDYEVGAALMLYQALTGDGGDKIRNARGPRFASDGEVKGDEIQRVFLKGIPTKMWRKTDLGYLLVDGYGHPFQFSNPGPDSVNTTYDVWSYGATEPILHVDKAVKQNEALTRLWIKNW